MKIAGQRRFSLVALILAVALLAAVAGCEGALQRGMLDGAYVSTARPDISIEVRNMPVLTAGRGMASLVWSDMMGSLPIDMWMARGASPPSP